MLFRALILAPVLALLAGCNEFLFYFGENNVDRGDVAYFAKQLDPGRDQNLSGGEIHILLNGITLVTRSINNPSAEQFGYFAFNRTMIVNPQPGITVDGTWRIDGQRLCYEIEGQTPCSNVKSAEVVAKDGSTQSVLYFVRAGTNTPTVMVTNVVAGLAIPENRL